MHEAAPAGPMRAPATRRVWIASAIVTALLLLVAWSVTPVLLPEGIRVPRYEASNLDAALLPPIWWPYSADEEARVEAMSTSGVYRPGVLLGTDRSGRDLLARSIAGGAVSVIIGLIAALLTVLIGTAWGVAAGNVGGRTDAALMRIVDVLFGLPTILLVVLLAVAVDGVWQERLPEAPPWAKQLVNVLVLTVAIGGVSWLTMARVIRGEVLSLRSRPFMEACRALAVPWPRQLRRHLLPNLTGPILVYAALAVPAAILSESFLSFLGIGVQPPVPSWGNLASDGLSELNLVHSRWWLLAWPCLLVGATLLLLNMAGDRLREKLDPMRRGR